MNETSFSIDTKKKEFINKLEKGIDGTLFAPYDRYGDKAYKTTHFGLSKLLAFAFDLLKKTDTNNTAEYYYISFSQFYNYVENAKNILTDMQYLEGVRLVTNKYNIVVYENPKNYSVVDLNKILPITLKQLRESYLVPDIYTSETGFLVYKDSKKEKSIEEKLTPREYKAFYGIEAKKSLDLAPTHIKKREFPKKTLQK